MPSSVDVSYWAHGHYHVITVVFLDIVFIIFPSALSVMLLKNGLLAFFLTVSHTSDLYLARVVLFCVFSLSSSPVKIFPNLQGLCHINTPN